MSLQKKNVIQEFIQENFVPSSHQQIVRFITGKGNNLHEVENSKGKKILVSMPQKYRSRVWLKRGDCIVIEPIAEGKQVIGEIICLLPLKTVIHLIQSNQWPSASTHTSTFNGSGDASENFHDKEKLLSFFNKNLETFEDNNYRGCTPTMPSSSEDESDTEETEPETKPEVISNVITEPSFEPEVKQVYRNDRLAKENDLEPEVKSNVNWEQSSKPEVAANINSKSEVKQANENENVTEENDLEPETKPEVTLNVITKQSSKPEVKQAYENDLEMEIKPEVKLTPNAEPEVDFKSRVQFLTSGIVTVTNVVNDLNSLLEPGINSLDFETEDSSAEESQSISPLPTSTEIPTSNSSVTSSSSGNSFLRQANTIRIQVNYPPQTNEKYM